MSESYEIIRKEVEQALERIAEVADDGVKVQAIVQRYLGESE